MTTQIKLVDVAGATNSGARLLLSAISGCFKDEIDEMVKEAETSGGNFEIDLKVNGREVDISFLADRIEENMRYAVKKDVEQIIKSKVGDHFHDLVNIVNGLGQVLEDEVNRRLEESGLSLVVEESEETKPEENKE